MGDDVFQFAGVLLEVVEFVGTLELGVVDVFVALGTEGSPTGRFWELGFEEVLAKEFGADLGFGVLQERTKRLSLDRGWNGGSGEVEEGGGDVDVSDQTRDFGAGLDELRVAQEKGDADGFVKRPAFVAEAVLAPEVAVVAREDEDGVVELFRLFESSENLPYSFVDGYDAAELVPDKFVRTAAAGLDVLHGGLVFEVVGGVGGDFYGFGFEKVFVALGGGEGAMDGFVANVGAEGLGAGFFDELGGVIGKDIGDVAGGFGLFSVDVKGGIVVDALTAEGDPAVEAGTGRGIVTHVPLAEEAGFVAAGF